MHFSPGHREQNPMSTTTSWPEMKFHFKIIIHYHHTLQTTAQPSGEPPRNFPRVSGAFRGAKRGCARPRGLHKSATRLRHRKLGPAVFLGARLRCACVRALSWRLCNRERQPDRARRNRRKFHVSCAYRTGYYTHVRLASLHSASLHSAARRDATRRAASPRYVQRAHRCVLHRTRPAFAFASWGPARLQRPAEIGASFPRFSPLPSPLPLPLLLSLRCLTAC